MQCQHLTWVLVQGLNPAPSGVSAVVGEAAEDGSRAWAPAPAMGDPEDTPGSWLEASAALAIAAI